MRKFAVNIFSTTGISLILLSIIALFFQAKCIYIQTVFQVLGANIVIHLGFVFLNKSEIKHTILEIFLHIMLIIITLFICGLIFRWFTSTPIWILVIMGIVIYIVSVILNVIYMGQEAREINILIKKRNDKKE